MLKQKECAINETIVEGFSKETFKEFLRFIYTGKVDFKLDIIGLMALAQLYEVETLKTICEHQMVLTLDDSNAHEIFNSAHRFGLKKELKEASFKLIQK